MADKLTQVFEQDGERWNPLAFHNITEEEAHKRYFVCSNFKKKTITAVWKRSNGLTVKTETPKRQPTEDAGERND